MDLQTRKLEFIQEFLKLSSEEAITKFEALLKKQKGDQENPFSQEESIERVMQSEADFERGDVRTTEQLLNRFQK